MFRNVYSVHVDTAIRCSFIRLIAKIPATAWMKNLMNAEIGQRVTHVNTLYIITLQNIVEHVKTESNTHTFLNM